MTFWVCNRCKLRGDFAGKTFAQALNRKDLVIAPSAFDAIVQQHSTKRPECHRAVQLTRIQVCTCGESPHRVLCPVGFQDYFGKEGKL